MKNLFLIRHAKSDWGFNVADIDRPLAKRGIEDAQKMASFLKNKLPDAHVICSVAKRTRQTASIFAETLEWNDNYIHYVKDLYTFDANQLANIIKSQNDCYENCILFGHNDAITTFVNTFGNNYIENVPTCGFVQIAFSVSNWSKITRGVIKNAVFPKQL